MFRRRRDTGQGRPASAGRHSRRDPEPAGDDELAEEAEEWVASMTSDPVEEPVGTGPWDAGERYPQRPRIDLGSLQVPVNPGQQIHLELTDDQNHIIAVSVTTADGGRLQMRALAAPKTAGLWADEVAEITEAIGQAGGESGEVEGPFGTEVAVREPPEPGSPGPGLVPARYIGVDGPRWLLIAKISGPAAGDAELARPLEEVIADTVVVRGDHPAPPRDLLEIQLPAEMRQAIAEQAAEAQAGQAQQAQYPNPFERGPEITETR